MHRLRTIAAFAATLTVLSACGSQTPLGTTADRSEPAGSPTPVSEVQAEPAAEVEVAPAPVASPAVTARMARSVTANDWTPFATVGGIVLHHPSARVERVGFHESNHDGAREMAVLDTAIRALTLESRERDTGAHTAADLVVDPDVEIRAPVTGTVKRAGTYVLYCEHSDDYAVIAPDANPAWEVKLLHIDGVRVRAGDRVEAGITVLASGPTPLPFRSQVDDETAEPSWPHVHIEVVDPSIPDRPSPGGGC
ncbi:MAG: M23 family metallopeptidase [Actinobacteria bacterium]|nr:M23 family metallopeptidase [Actinomycetota bacterium]